MLSGSNASGKSSIMQCLVLLHQTMVEHEWSNRLVLNGHTLQLGTAQDVIDKVHGRHSFELGISLGENSFDWSFSGEREDMSLEIKNVTVNTEYLKNPEKLQYLLPYGKNLPVSELAQRLYSLTYITAERIGPRDYYPLEDELNAQVVGPKGEHSISLLYSKRDKKVSDRVAIKPIAPTLINQVQAWMQCFFPKCELTVEKVAKINAVTLGLRTSNDTNFHRPIHVGFGLTQILPIIVASLAADVGDMLLIENPEVHLHPSGQVLMGQFLAAIADSGVQVVLETHSDHILNGIRRSVKNRNISENNVTLHYVRAREEDHDQVITPQIDEQGNIDFWPEGFFDQFDKDINFFAGWGD